MNKKTKKALRKLAKYFGAVAKGEQYRRSAIAFYSAQIMVESMEQRGKISSAKAFMKALKNSHETEK